MLTNLFYILIAILILGVIIIMHEFGHYAVGRMTGIGVVEFSVGFGPKLVGWSRKGIQYSLRAIPLGGFCKFVGEDEDNAAANAMNNQPVWKRFMTVAAGPAMNFVLAYVAAVAMLCMFYVADVYPSVESVAVGTPAEAAQLLQGDVIIAANGKEIAYGNQGVADLRALIAETEELHLTLLRGDETIDVDVTPAVVTAEDGSSARQVGIIFASRTYSLGEAISGAGRYMVQVTVSMLDMLRNLFFKGEGLNEVTGIVGTVAVVSEIVQTDSKMILDILFLLSLNIGIMNLLPLPALDGGRLVFLIIEAIRRKTVPPEKEGMVHAAGLVLLFGLMIYLVFRDVFVYVL